MPSNKISRARWLTALEKEKIWDSKREDIERRLNERKLVWSRLLDLLKGEVIFDSSKRILDIGAEATSIFLALKEGERYAVDPLFEYLFDLHPFLKEVEEYKDVNFISSPIEDLASDKNFDIIFMLATLDHVDKLKPLIDKVDEVLAPSGTLVIMVDCYTDPIVKNLMNFFDVEIDHLHYFVAEDIIRLFSNYKLKKQEQISEIYHDCPFRGQRRKLEIYRIDKLIVRMWQVLGEDGKRGDILFALKFFLCRSLALLVALLMRRQMLIQPTKEPWLFVFQKQ